jgi:hypothetical protein
MKPNTVPQIVAIVLTLMIWTSATITPVLAMDTTSSLTPFLNNNDTQELHHISITEIINPTADPAAIINTSSERVTLHILNPIETGLVDTTTYTPDRSSVDTAVTNLLNQGYTLSKHSNHVYQVSTKPTGKAAPTQLNIAVSYYVFVYPNPEAHPDQLLTVTQLVDDTGHPLGPKNAVTSPLKGSIEDALGQSTTQTSRATERTPLIPAGATGLAAGVAALGVGASIGVAICVGVAIAVTIYCAWYCVYYIYNPEYETTEIPVTDANPIYEFTLIKNTIGPGTYVPPGSILTYLDDGSATVQYPLSWWKRPFTYGTIKHYVPISTDNHEILRCIECPNGALVDYSTNNNEPTIIYENEDKDTPLLTMYTQSPKKASPTSRKPLEIIRGAGQQSWVEWANITPPPSTTHYTSFSSSWIVPKNPLKTEDYPSDKNGNMFYAWVGLQTKDNVNLPHGYLGGVNQPVLTWNCGHLKPGVDTCSGFPKEEHWSGAAWSAPSEQSNQPTTHGNIIYINPWDTITGSLNWKEKNHSWTITFTDTTTGEVSTLISPHTIPNEVLFIEPYFTLEKYPPRLNLICNDGEHKKLWPQGNFKFTNIILKNQNRNDITAQSRVHIDYNEKMFAEAPSTWCTPHLPTFEPNHYWVDINHWPSSVTLEIPSSPMR